MENKLKIGDKVRIRNDLKGDNSYGGLYFDYGMEKFNGETHEIVELNQNGNYRLDIDIEERYYWVWNDAMVEFVEKGFTKADLKPGMVVEMRDGNRFLLIDNTLIGSKEWDTMNSFADDLINKLHHDCDICKVYHPKGRYVEQLLDDKYLTLIWEREEAKEMTVAEIEKQLGYKVKVISDKED